MQKTLLNTILNTGRFFAFRDQEKIQMFLIAVSFFFHLLFFFFNIHDFGKYNTERVFWPSKVLCYFYMLLSYNLDYEKCYVLS